MLQPKRVKHRKQHTGRLKGKSGRANSVDFGDYGLQATEPARVKSRQIEAARVAMTRKIERAGKVWVRIFPDIPITAKPAEVRMGKGKGNIEAWAARVKSGRMLFEMEGVDEERAREAMRAAAHKLPMHTQFVKRRGW